MHFSLCDTILDLVQNSVESGAGRIELTLREGEALLETVLRDDGCGMTEEEQRRALDPFFSDGKKHRNRTVGLGLPFLKQQLETSGGSFRMESARGEGTVLEIRFRLDHIDTPPIGDIPSLFLQALCFDGAYQMVITREKTRKDQSLEYRLDRRELMGALGDFSDASSMILLREYLRSQEESEEGIES